MASDDPVESWRNTERQFRIYTDRFYKRSLRPDEYIVTFRGDRYVPPQGYERLHNEAACLRFIREHTNIPVPEVLEAFDDEGAFVVVTKLLPGVQMCKLSAVDQAVVMKEVETHLNTLRSLRSDRTGGPSGMVCPPPRASQWFPKNTTWLSTTPAETELVFCHCDLSQSNILVDPDTLKIEGILDWEFAGYWPSSFEAPFFQDPRPSGAQFTSRSDNAQVVDFLQKQGHKLEDREGK